MEILVPLMALLGVYHTIRIYRAGRAAKEQFPVVDYESQSTANTDPWRWRKPHEKLAIQLNDETDKSSIRFDPHFNFTDYFTSVAGIAAYSAAVIFLLSGSWYYLFGGAEDGIRAGGGFTLAIFGFIFGTCAMNFRQRITCLTRTSSHLVLEYTYGAFFKRKIYFNKGAKINMKVKDQSISDYDSSQAAPFYEIFLAKRKLVSLVPAKFYIYVNQSQITWLKGGLNDWFNPAVKSAASEIKNTEIFTPENQVKENTPAVAPAELKETIDRHI